MCYIVPLPARDLDVHIHLSNHCRFIGAFHHSTPSKQAHDTGPIERNSPSQRLQHNHWSTGPPHSMFGWSALHQAGQPLIRQQSRSCWKPTGIAPNAPLLGEGHPEEASGRGRERGGLGVEAQVPVHEALALWRPYFKTTDALNKRKRNKNIPPTETSPRGMVFS